MTLFNKEVYINHEVLAYLSLRYEQKEILMKPPDRWMTQTLPQLEKWQFSCREHFNWSLGGPVLSQRAETHEALTTKRCLMWLPWSLLLERTPRVLCFSQPRISASRHSHNKPRIPVFVSQDSEVSFDISIAGTNSQASTIKFTLILDYTVYWIFFFTLMSWYYSQGTIAKSIPSKKL